VGTFLTHSVYSVLQLIDQTNESCSIQDETSAEMLLIGPTITNGLRVICTIKCSC